MIRGRENNSDGAGLGLAITAKDCAPYIKEVRRSTRDEYRPRRLRVEIVSRETKQNMGIHHSYISTPLSRGPALLPEIEATGTSGPLSLSN